ncbi:MAG TPA: molybdopterin cofactor-binding domain-containing protein, partial [Ktedonobacterales bacterium]|nr:molybdopterin cofactor-binding domain-containing protein [Ktedonobacterales bacterium]
MPIRIITTHLEFEGEVSEQRVVMEGEEPPVWGPDAELGVVGKPTPRVDGPERASGAAQYAYDMQLPGMLTAIGLRSPHAHARVVAVDAARAETLPGVRAVFHRFNTGDLLHPANDAPLFAEEIVEQGGLVALIIAESRELAEDARAAIAVQYEPLPAVSDPEAALVPGAVRVNTAREDNSLSEEYPRTYQRGDVERGLAEADATVEVRFETPTAVHNSLETHGGVAQWDGRTLTIWSSTQDLFGARRSVAKLLGLQQNQVRAIKQYMGGGFGSKFGAHVSGLLAAYAAKTLGQPVKYMLSRESENLVAGNRPPSIQTYRLGAKRDGTLTAIDLRTIENAGANGTWMCPVALPAKELYECANVRTVDQPIRTNLGTFSAFRAPGVVEGIAGLEVAVDRLAAAIGMDPLAFRLKNYA